MRWATRHLMRRLVMLAVTAFVVGYLSTGSVDQVFAAIGKIPQALGVTELVDRIGADTTAAKTRSKPRTATVSRVVDGDTLEVTFANGKDADVRLLAYDTPEPYRYGTPECGSKRASAFTTKLAYGKPVKLTVDPTQDTVDMYGRLLRYARIDGKDLGRQVIAAGWGAPYVFNEDSPPKNIGYYRTAATNAKNAGRGVWGLCDGNFHSEEDQPWSGD